ncbi:MAG: hypothetical protein R2911_09440 [Caldilineaceae bacterium]
MLLRHSAVAAGALNCLKRRDPQSWPLAAEVVVGQVTTVEWLARYGWASY